MDGRMLARLGAIIFVALAVTATVREFNRREQRPASSQKPPLQATSDPLREGLRRCQRLGAKAGDDQECLNIWAKNRDQFLGRTSAQERR